MISPDLYHLRAAMRAVTYPTFRDWLIANGAEILFPCASEFMRFRAHGILCVVSEGRKGRTPHPDLARDACAAFLAGRALDLRNEARTPVEDWHATGIALCGVAARAKAGEDLDIDAEAQALRIPPERLMRSMRAHGAVKIEGGQPA